MWVQPVVVVCSVSTMRMSEGLTHWSCFKVVELLDGTVAERDERVGLAGTWERVQL